MLNKRQTEKTNLFLHYQLDKNKVLTEIKFFIVSLDLTWWKHRNSTVV